MAPAVGSLVELVRDPGLAGAAAELAAGATVVSRDVSLAAGGSGPVVQVNGAPLTTSRAPPSASSSCCTT
jgi:hypothetical protein